MSWSHPTRVRGLKLHRMMMYRQLFPVAPHAGAWIETRPPRAPRSPWRKSHPTRVRGLKPHSRRPLCSRSWSHPTRVRGLKPSGPEARRCVPRSHPTRVRGLKHCLRTSWSMELNVAPHAGAWIETDFTPPRSDGRRGVAPHAGAWIETKSAPDSGPEVGWSHPTRVRGLKRFSS